jgi:DNA-binding transcriptional regulator PaaX
MRAHTEEFLYTLLWGLDLFMRPSLRRAMESYEVWAYRNGLSRQLNRLESGRLIERKPIKGDQRIYRLTEAGRLHAVGGRDPEARWSRKWDGHWRIAFFDVPLGQESTREKFRRFLRDRDFGCLQKSVWISPDPVADELLSFEEGAKVGSLIMMEGRPCGGETDAEIVAAAWDFKRIAESYAAYLKVLHDRPTGMLHGELCAKAFRRWLSAEREAWLSAVKQDPLLPEVLWPETYPGRKAWASRRELLQKVADQIHSFRLT